MRADTADKALEAGAHIINDVSGGLADPDMFAVVAQAECDFVVMHWRGHSESMEAHAHYGDVVAEVRSELGARVAAAVGAGIDPARIIVDPGLGFGKKANHNWELLKHCDDLVAVGTRMVVGASRKRFVGALLPDGHAMTERDEPSAVLGALLASQGVWALRVHNVAAQARALDVWQAVTQGGTHV
jgi:dihydropteroate synthase